MLSHARLIEVSRLSLLAVIENEFGQVCMVSSFESPSALEESCAVASTCMHEKPSNST